METHQQQMDVSCVVEKRWQKTLLLTAECIVFRQTFQEIFREEKVSTKKESGWENNDTIH